MSDVWPRRNLGRGENWGRVVENRLDSILRKLGIGRQGQDSFDRYSASTSDSVSDLAAQIRSALLAYPIYFTRSQANRSFEFGPDWTTVAAVSIPNPGGYRTLKVDAIGGCTSYQAGDVVNRFIWPFSLDYVTSEYGPRPPLPFHNGIDFSYGGIEGTAIPVTHNGVVNLNAYYDDWGNYMRVDCSPLTGYPDSWTGYAHMQSPGLYPIGATVTQGQTIGYVGTTGQSTGPHLHYETATEDTRMNPRDFMAIFGGGTVALQKVTARIVVNGSISPEFEPYRGDDIPRYQSNFPIWSNSVQGDDPGVSVQLQMKTTARTVPAEIRNTATLTIRGGFER